MNLFLRRMIVVIALGISSFASTVYSAENSTSDHTAKTIIMRMADTYKNCKSYLDSGTVTTTFFMQKGSYIDKILFTTAFMRPGQFRFAYSSKQKSKIKHHIILVKNKEVFVWKDAKSGIEKEPSLSDAVADATGKSGGASQTIPVLIGASKVGGRSLADLLKVKRIEDSLRDNIMCYRIQGKRMPSSTSFVTLWISKKTFLIHRIESSQKFSNFRTETVKIYKPHINIAIPETKLNLNAPE